MDKAIIERADKVATIRADIEWGDIGSWAPLTDVLPADDAGNLFSGEIVAIDAANSTVYGRKDRVVALIGVDDLVVVDTADALLVCLCGLTRLVFSPRASLRTPTRNADGTPGENHRTQSAQAQLLRLR